MFFILSKKNLKTVLHVLNFHYLLGFIIHLDQHRVDPVMSRRLKIKSHALQTRDNKASRLYQSLRLGIPNFESVTQNGSRNESKTQD